MSERDCSHCRNHTDDGCKKWECEYVPNDLIKRQDAIDAISTWDKFGVDERNRLVRWYEGLEPYVKLRDVVWAIEKLPSAEPEIICCKDCKYSVHWYRDRRRCFLWHEVGVAVFDLGFCNYAERREDAI